MSGLKLYLVNSFWMLLEQILRLVSGLVVGVYVARNVGPEAYGILIYSLSLMTMLMPFAKMGMDSLLVRDLMNGGDRERRSVSACALMFAGGGLGWLGLSGYALIKHGFSATGICIALSAFALIFQCFLVFDYQFQSTLRARISSAVKSGGLIVGLVLKVVLVHLGADIEYVAAAYMLDHVVIALFLLIVSIKYKLPMPRKIFFKADVVALFRSALPMIFSAVAISVYASVDKIFVFDSYGTEGLGVYASATRLVDGVAMLVVVICSSILPLLIGVKKTDDMQYRLSVTRMYAVVFWLGGVFSVLVCFYSRQIINILFGGEFMEARAVLQISIWSIVFLGFGSVTVRYLVVEGMEKKLMFRSLLMALMNIGLCWFLVPEYGLVGAAGAVLLSVMIANYLADYFSRDMRPLFWIKTRAVFLIGIW